jgi:hypothetical protein
MENRLLIRHDPEVEKIFSKIPNCLTRWGITLILMIMVFVIIISNFIIFPDVVKTKATITMSNNFDFKVKIMVPQTSIFSLNPGSAFILKFESFPYQKCGVYKSLIQNVRQKTILEDYFIIEVDIPKNIRTSTNKEILMINGLKADCDIVISQISLFKKFIGYINWKI